MHEDSWPEVRVYLSFMSDSDVSGEISALIGQPDRVDVKGQPYDQANPTRIRPKNRYLFGQLKAIRCLDVPELASRVLSQIKSKGPAIVALGVQVELTIVVELSNGQAPILSFASETLAILHEANGQLDVDIYL